MKKVTWEAQTERMYVQLVQEVPDNVGGEGMMPSVMTTSDFPAAYIMIGKPGSKERTRVEGPDTELLLMVLSKIMPYGGPGVGMRTIGRPPEGPPYGVAG